MQKESLEENINLDNSPHIVIAGASGYIGTSLIPELLKKFPNAKITGFSRSPRKSKDPRIVWKECDLFSLKSLEQALPKKFDLAFYLVHSMGPTAQLDQGSFSDYDLILADNFARSLKNTGVQHLIYLGGLIPDTKPLSLHLQSRLEVEETFLEHRLPITVFRAGLILGEGGSSFQILLKLVNRLPVMVCPPWTQTLTTPVDISTVVTALSDASLKKNHIGRTYDLTACKPLSYIDMMRLTAARLGKKRFFIKVPFFTQTLSRLWVSVLTNTPKNLVYPLIESLSHNMVARENHFYPTARTTKDYADLIRGVNTTTKSGLSFFSYKAPGNTVRSVQRLPLPKEKNAEWVRQQYVSWLPSFLRPFILVKTTGEAITFSIFNSRIELLELELSRERSDPDRQLLYIEGGLLAAKGSRGRLEFRVVLQRKFVMAAIHAYKPSLPWFIYKLTQAQLHLYIMRGFSHHLKKIQDKNKKANPH